MLPNGPVGFYWVRRLGGKPEVAEWGQYPETASPRWLCVGDDTLIYEGEIEVIDGPLPAPMAPSFMAEREERQGDP